LSDPEVVVVDDGVQQNSDAEGGNRDSKSRYWLILLPLLLLLCATTVAVDHWVTRGPDQAVFIARNLECLQCHTELIPDMGLESVHNPFMHKECTVCHTVHGREIERTITSGTSTTFERVRAVIEWLPLNIVVSLFDGASGVTQEQGSEPPIQDRTTGKVVETESNLIVPIEDLCWICHGDLGPKLAYPYGHDPFSRGQCMTCHEPHASQYSALLLQDERDLCITCHSVGTEMARDQTHPPFAQRVCLDCHDPHASEWSGILVSRQTELCFRCHPSVAPLSKMPVQHQPFEYDNCMGCHEPHGSDYRPLLLKAEQDLCYDCHPDIKDEFQLASIHPVGTYELNCADCHDAHAANYSGLLIAEDNELCYTCHSAAIEPQYEASAHSAILCVDCHTPHGSSYAPILVSQNPDLCLECHNPRYYDESSRTVRRNNHPVRPVHFDVNNRTPLTCTSSCHDPHGTDYAFMMRYMDGPYDGNCLICHAVIEGERVGVDF